MVRDLCLEISITDWWLFGLQSLLASAGSFKWINKEGDITWVKLHYKTKSGIKNLKSDDAAQLYTDPDYATRDLVAHIDQGKTS